MSVEETVQETPVEETSKKEALEFPQMIRHNNQLMFLTSAGIQTYNTGEIVAIYSNGQLEHVMTAEQAIPLTVDVNELEATSMSMKSIMEHAGTEEEAIGLYRNVADAALSITSARVTPIKLLTQDETSTNVSDDVYPLLDNAFGFWNRAVPSLSAEVKDDKTVFIISIQLFGVVFLKKAEGEFNQYQVMPIFPTTEAERKSMAFAVVHVEPTFEEVDEDEDPGQYNPAK